MSQQSEPQPFDKQTSLPRIQNIVLVGSGKGGVGKSTVTVNLASALKNQGLKVGILDADIYGPSLPRMLGCLNQKPLINNENKIEPILRYQMKIMSLGFLIEENQSVIWRGPMLFKALNQLLFDINWGELDFLIVDLPPGTGDVALTLAQKVKISGALLVCTPQNIALADAKKAVDMFQKVNIPLLGAIENMAGFYSVESNQIFDLFPKGDLDTYLKAQNIPKFASLPLHPHISLASESGIPLLEQSKVSNESMIFIEIAKKISASLN